MVKQVVWSPRAQSERKSVLKYWLNRNKSKTYSLKLNLLIKEGISLILSNQEIGRKTDVPNVRIKIVRDYLIFYEVQNETIYILSFWDSRQNTEKLRL
ncbi:MAG: toxin YoeB [Roseivirga sp.]|jgi:plasmid stabilization system protein ParE